MLLEKLINSHVSILGLIWMGTALISKLSRLLYIFFEIWDKSLKALHMLVFKESLTFKLCNSTTTFKANDPTDSHHALCLKLPRIPPHLIAMSRRVVFRVFPINHNKSCFTEYQKVHLTAPFLFYNRIFKSVPHFFQESQSSPFVFSHNIFYRSWQPIIRMGSLVVKIESDLIVQLFSFLQSLSGSFNPALHINKKKYQQKKI